ncbi:MAG: transporter substrate-binding domain-containing protein [Pseudonocardiaceae bacterium]
MSRAALISLTAIVVTALVATATVVYVYNRTWQPEVPASFLHGSVTVGSATDQPGLSLLDPGTNRTVGFDADFIRWLGDNSSRKWNPQLVPTSVDQRVPALEQKSLQLVIQSFSITDERLKVIDMAGPYLVSRQGVLVRKGDTRFSTPDTVAGKNICAPKGSTSVEELRSRRAQVTTEPGVGGCVARLKDRQVDAVSTDQLLLYGYAQHDPSLYVEPRNTFGLQEEYGVGLPYGSYTECMEISEAIRRFVDSPGWDDYLRIHFGEFDRAGSRPTGLNPCLKR